MMFNSHVLTLVEVAARLVNALVPAADDPVAATAEALGGQGRPTPRVTAAQAEVLASYAVVMRRVFELAAAGDLAGAAADVNTLLDRSGARPQLDPVPDGEGWHVHFHGTTDDLDTGWAAGCASGLALAIGSDLAGRLGVCDAERCDRVYVDVSKNGLRRFCSTTCQNRTKAAAHRARVAGLSGSA